MAQWFESDWFWEEWYDYIFPSARFDIADQEVEQVLALSGITTGSALDLCCGPGRHAIALAQRGFQVTGVDRAAFLLEKARDLAGEKKIKVEWVQADMLHFERANSYDLVVSLFHSFGYFEKKLDDLRVLQHIFASLKPGGIFVIDVNSKEWLAGNLCSALWSRQPDGSIVVEHHEVSQDWTRLKNEWIRVRGDRASTFVFDYTIYSGQELRDLLAKAGFQEICLYGSFAGDAYDRNASRLIAVARKGETGNGRRGGRRN